MTETDTRICVICDGGPGNECACSCGFQRWDGPITLADVTEGQAYSSLGPIYFAARRFASGLAEGWNPEQFKPLVDKITDDIRSALWEHVQNSLVEDLEYNVAGTIRDGVDQTVNALLSGEAWAMQRYPYAKYDQGEKVRKAIAVHVGDEIARRRIEDLEAQVVKLEERYRDATRYR